MGGGVKNRWERLDQEFQAAISPIKVVEEVQINLFCYE